VLASFSSVLMAVLQRSTGLSLSSELGTKLPLSKLQDFQDHKLQTTIDDVPHIGSIQMQKFRDEEMNSAIC
jgi:hypothetical protein